MVRIFHDFQNVLRQHDVLVAKVSVHAVFDQILHPVGRGADHRRSQRHGFQRAHGRSLPAGGQDHRLAVRHHFDGVTLKAQKMHVVLQAQFSAQCLHFPFQLPRADHRHLNVRLARFQCGAQTHQALGIFLVG